MVAISESVLTGDQALTTESFTELNSKLGAQWYISEQFSVANGQTVRVVFDFPADKDNRVLLKSWAFDSNERITFNIYWKLTGWDANDGTAVDIKNFHDNPDNNTIATCTIDPTAGTAPTEQQRAVTLLTADTTNQSKEGLFRESQLEYVLTFNQQVMFEFTRSASGAADINFGVTWYEGPLSTDRKKKTAGGF